MALAVKAKDVHVLWNPSSDALTDPTITYIVFVYTNSAVDTNSLFTSVPAVSTNAVVTNLLTGKRYWANVVAVDTNGLMSDPSNTTSFIFPGAPTSLHLVP